MSNSVIDLNQNPLNKNGSERRLSDKLPNKLYKITALILLIICLILIFYILHNHHVFNQSHPKPCLTADCIDAASRIIRSLNTNVDPCQDFYAFSCGGWINKTILPHGQKRIGTLNSIQETVNNKLRVDLNNLSDNIRKLDRDSYEYKLVHLYRTCLNVGTPELKNNQAFFDTLVNHFGGWFTSDNNLTPVESDIQLEKEIIKLKELGFSYSFLISIYVGPDLKNTSRNLIALDQAELALKQRSLYFQNAYLTSYASFIFSSAQRLGIPTSLISPSIYAIVQLEKIFANITTPPEMRREFSKVYSKMTLGELQNYAINIDWMNLLSKLVNKSLPMSEEIIMFDKEYIKKLDDLIPQIDARIFHNYLVWRVIYEMMPYLTKEWRDAYYVFHEGQKSDKARWEECLEFMMDPGMDVALSSLYVNNHCDPETKKMATMAFNYVKEEFVKIIELTDWMGESTKNMAKKKVQSMGAYIAYPEQMLNRNIIDEFYQELQMDTNDFASNIIALKKWHKKLELKQLHRNTNELWWRQTVPAVVNAYYNPLENKIQLPASLLQGGFFNKNRPYYLNFASFGFLIGHEITHGFDERGKQFDENGNLINWWDEETDEKFRNKIQCMISQYNSYNIKRLNMSISGTLTKGENLADNGGVKLALKAYESWSANNPKEPGLPGLPYSASKLFWIGGANFWCEKQTRTALQNQLLRDEHSPGEFRVIGPFSNMPEFAEAFNCKPKSRMNPDRKCSVW